MSASFYDLAYIDKYQKWAESASISCELLAAKLQRIRNLEYPAIAKELEERPRLVELCWFLQKMTMRPGGLGKFTCDFLKAFPEHLSTPTMRACALPKNGRYSLETCLAIFKDDPGYKHESEVVKDGQLFQVLLSEDSPGIRAIEKEERAFVREVIETLTPLYFWRKCAGTALERLPHFFASICTEASLGFRDTGLWFFGDLFGTLFKMMDRHAEKEGACIAGTKLTKVLFKELKFTLREKVPGLLVGSSRTGKTKGVSVHCDMYPGRERCVTVPDSNTLRDLIAAHADAFAIPYTHKTTERALKSVVEFVLHNSGLGLAYDESHFLIPSHYSHTTAPKRLNWIRCQVIDKGIGCVFCATPQAYDTSLRSFSAKTDYALEQWLGRIPLRIDLPPDLGKDDLLAVGRFHFPELDSLLLEFIAARTMQSEGYLKNFEATAKRAMFLAREDGRRKPSLDDVKEAVDDIMPSRKPDAPIADKAAVQESARKASASALQVAGRLSARRSQAKASSDRTFSPARSVTPAPADGKSALVAPALVTL